MRLLRTLGLWAALVSVLSLPIEALSQPAVSSAQRLANLEAAVAALTQSVTNLQTENAAQATSISALQSALNQAVASSKTYADGVGASTLASAKSYADTKDSTALTSAKAYSDGLLAAAKTYADGQVAPVADKLTHFSRSGNEVYITGANLNIRNGTGFSYQRLNGLGNLVVGYNDLRTGTNVVNIRTGSHNVILGFNQNYSQAGALMLGAVNNSTGLFASVLGGTGNTSSGLYAAVVGGFNNAARGNWSTILGGCDVTAANALDHKP
jgi:hypothetical protein